MALPPIVTNSPIYKALVNTTTEKRPAQLPADEAKAASTQQDSVNISDEALKKLEELKSADIKTTDKARETAGDVRTTLEDNTDIRLGAEDPDDQA